jgi:hypothetical protein
VVQRHVPISQRRLHRWLGPPGGWPSARRTRSGDRPTHQLAASSSSSTTTASPQLVRQTHRQSWQFWLGLGGAGLVALGSLLPWATVDTVTFGTRTKYGIEGDGVFTLIGGAVFAVFFLLHHALWQRVVATLIALGLLWVAVVDFSGVHNNAEKAEAEAVSAGLTASVGVGLWMVLVGSVGMVAGVLLRRSTRS